MSRRHLESALVAGALIESGLKPCFRFTRVRFVRHCFPPGYDSSKHYRSEDPTNAQKNDQAGMGGYAHEEGVYDEDDDDKQLRIPPTLTLTCNCCPSTPATTNGNTELNVAALFGDGDCEMPQPVGTGPCKMHTEEFLRKKPWRRLKDDYSVHAVQFSPDGKQLLVGSANTSVRVIQTADGKQHLLPRPSKWTLGMPITAIRFMPPKAIWAVACNAHGEVFAFKPDCEGFETLFKEPQQTYTLDFSPDGSELATAGVDRKIRIYTLHPGTVIGLPSELKDPCDWGTVNRYTGSTIIGRRIQAMIDATRDELPNSTRFHFPGGRPDQIVDLTVKPYTLTRCYGTPDLLDPPDLPEPAGYVSDPRLAPPLREYVPSSPGVNLTEGHSKRIMALRFHPQKSSLLFSAGWDNIVKVWDTRLQSGPVWQIYGPHVASPDGLDVDDNHLLTASWRATNSIEIWDLRTLHYNTCKLRNAQMEMQPKSATNEGDSSGYPLSGNLSFDVPSKKLDATDGPVEVIPISGSVWVPDRSKESGEYPYAARLLPSRAVVAAGSGFYEVRVVGRDTLLPIVRVPVDSVVQSMDAILEGRYIGVGCASGTVSLIGLA